VTDLAEQADVVLVVGSQNSSNSKRLVETAKEQGKPGYLIDDETELEATWLAEVSTVLVTAGASAPDDLVQALLERLRDEFGGVVETYTLVEEDVSFELPKSVKRLLVLN
jgi:4-hydroxy-3-methylbut-2-enyl diphosphate reductase